MKSLMMLILGLTFLISNAESCVTFTPSTGSYTVDKRGCVGKVDSTRDSKNNKSNTPAKK